MYVNPQIHQYRAPALQWGHLSVLTAMSTVAPLLRYRGRDSKNVCAAPNKKLIRSGKRKNTNERH